MQLSPWKRSQVCQQEEGRCLATTSSVVCFHSEMKAAYYFYLQQCRLWATNNIYRCSKSAWRKAYCFSSAQTTNYNPLYESMYYLHYYNWGGLKIRPSLWRGVSIEMLRTHEYDIPFVRVGILFQSEKCNIGLQSFIIVFVWTREPILSIFP